MVQQRKTVKNGSKRSRISEDSGTSNVSYQRERESVDISDSEEELSSLRRSFGLGYPLLRESTTMSPWPHGHLTDFMTPSPPGSTSSQDSGSSNVSCQSKRSKDDIITFKEEPSSRRRDQDSGTASASRQSDSSNGDNIHGQEEPSSVRSRIKRHSCTSIESCLSKRSKGDTLLSVPLQRFLKYRFGLGYPLLREPWTMISLSDGHLTDFMKPSPPERRRSNDLLKELLSCKSRTMISGSDDRTTDFMKPSPPLSIISEDSDTSSASYQSDRSKGKGIDFQKGRSSPRSIISEDSDTSSASYQSDRSKGKGIDFQKGRSSPRRNKDSGTASASCQSDSSNGDNVHGQEELYFVRRRRRYRSGIGYPLLRESRAMISGSDDHLTDFMTPSPPGRTPRRRSAIIS